MKREDDCNDWVKSLAVVHEVVGAWDPSSSNNEIDYEVLEFIEVVSLSVSPADTLVNFSHVHLDIGNFSGEENHS